ncbi:unnamed protein product, partial [marine sediment metagenome]
MLQFQLDERHYGFIESIENKLYEENLGCFIVGWFHSHPGLGLFYSYVDLINHIGFQGKNKDACGLVFDHTLLGKKKRKKVANSEHMITKYDTGFEIYRMNDVNMDINDPGFENNYHKVDYFIDGLNKFFFAVLTFVISNILFRKTEHEASPSFINFFRTGIGTVTFIILALVFEV